MRCPPLSAATSALSGNWLLLVCVLLLYWAVNQGTSLDWEAQEMATKLKRHMMDLNAFTRGQHGAKANEAFWREAWDRFTSLQVRFLLLAILAF